MSPIRLLFKGVDVSALHQELLDNPEVWNRYSPRRETYDGPHSELSDYWVRYNAWENYHGDMQAFNESHESVWYPESELTPSVKPIVFGLMSAVQGERLGAVLITKIPPKTMCKPHIDRGWHAQYYDKYAVQIAGNERQAFHFQTNSLVTFPGDVFAFDNEHVHWVTNDSDEDRITLIVCIRNAYRRA